MSHELLNGHTVQGLWGLQTKERGEKCEPFLKYKDKFYHEYMDLALIDHEQFSDYPKNSEVKVSNLGRVMYKGEISPQTKDKNDYLVVDIGEKYKTAVHQLVAETFLKKDNPDPKTYNIIHHISANIYDNRAENLLYVTCEQHTLIHHGDMRLCFSNIKHEKCGWKFRQENCMFGNTVLFSESMSPEWKAEQKEMMRQYDGE